MNLNYNDNSKAQRFPIFFVQIYDFCVCVKIKMKFIWFWCFNARKNDHFFPPCILFLWWMKGWWWIRCLEIVITVEYEPENETIAIHCTSTLSLNTYITWRNNSDSNSTHRFETIQTVLITFWTKFFVCLILHLAQPNSFLYSHAAITGSVRIYAVFLNRINGFI